MWDYDNKLDPLNPVDIPSRPTQVYMDDWMPCTRELTKVSEVDVEFYTTNKCEWTAVRFFHKHK